MYDQRLQQLSHIPPLVSDAGQLEEEVPPIPCHVHAGNVVGGHCVGHGKTEAYFFPPVDVPPYNLSLGSVKTRLGLRSGVEKEEVCVLI